MSASPRATYLDPTDENARRLQRGIDRHTLPFLAASGGSVEFYGTGGHTFVGPPDERWDSVMLIGQSSPKAFSAFASNPEYLAGVGHRTAALEDSRLLPLVDRQLPRRAKSAGI